MRPKFSTRQCLQWRPDIVSVWRMISIPMLRENVASTVAPGRVQNSQLPPRIAPTNVEGLRASVKRRARSCSAIHAGAAHVRISALRFVPLLALALAGCSQRPFEIRDYHGRCGDPPHGTAVRVLGCELRMNDHASGGDWRFVCD
jgi:hypothetical protein